MTMWIGALEFDLLLGDVHSLKMKRAVVRRTISEVRRRFDVSVAEVDHLDRHRRTGLGVAVVASDAAYVMRVLDEVERMVAARPETELLAARRSIRNSED
jgi:uncharacterized protein YlxP (DUF503 family)